MLGGRGAGKTRAGAEWVRALALGHAWASPVPVGRIALVGETFSDVREVMVEGVSGLLAVHRAEERPLWRPSRRRLEWSNGAVAQLFSSEDPEALRGPQFGAAWSDELAKWRYSQETFDMLQFCLRLGESPRQLVTTTPRATGLLKRLMGDPATVMTRAPTAVNAGNLAPAFLKNIVKRYAGTRLGRQELDGELIEDRPGALWTRALLEAGRAPRPPELSRVVVALDPPATSGRKSDACGVVVAGLGEDGDAYVLEDASIAQARPSDWARLAVTLWHKYKADALVAEVNQGGEMVAQIIAGVDPDIPVRGVRARRGKYLRAEPVAMLYVQGRVHHVGAFPELEDEMSDFTPEGLTSGRSPDRMDALVWALTELCLGRAASEPRMRRV